jgi:hypothetical protein
LYISKQFKDYRQLALNLEASGGIVIGNMSASDDIEDDSIRGTTGSVRSVSHDASGEAVVINCSFPATYKKSQFGISLTNEQLIER